MNFKFQVLPTKDLDNGLQGDVMLGNKITLNTGSRTTSIALNRGPLVKISINYHFRERKQTESISSIDDNLMNNNDNNDDIFDQLTIDDIANY